MASIKQVPFDENVIDISTTAFLAECKGKIETIFDSMSKMLGSLPYARTIAAPVQYKEVRSVPTPPEPFTPVVRAMKLYKDRRFRESLFDADTFADPAWDILIDLYIAAKSGNRISITSACIASMVPPTTALRYISVMTDKGLVTREEDESDRRRAFICLTPVTMEKMELFFTRAPSDKSLLKNGDFGFGPKPGYCVSPL